LSVLTLERVSKRFDQTIAVDDLSFSVEQGTVFGFLGGNGAGKTTSLRMVLDIIRPTSGRIEVLGRAPGRANAPDIGFLPEERGLYRQMTALDTIAYFGRLKGMTPADAKREGAALLDRFGLADNAKMSVDKLSKGMAQKVQLATALVNRPRLLILDEPFSGLDPVNQGLLEDQIRRMSAAGSTVVFSTHVMQHAERLCDRLLLLARGRKKFEGTLDEARAELPARLAVVAKDDPSRIPGVESAEEQGEAEPGWRRWDVRLAPGVEPGHVLEQCVAEQFPLRRFEQLHASLHDVFVHIVGTPENAETAQ
jgi:ABC-2 type transport system ATP-binding protein